jgi:hypothetical protein
MRAALRLAALVLGFGILSASLRAGPEPEKKQPPTISQLIALVGADQNNAYSTSIPFGASISLPFQLKKFESTYTADLTARSFATTDQPPAAVQATLSKSEAPSAPTASSTSVSLDLGGPTPTNTDLWLRFVKVPAGKTLKGKLVLRARANDGDQDLQQIWDLTVAVGSLGPLGVDPIGTVKVVAGDPFGGCADNAFAIQLSDRSMTGPFHGLSAGLEATPAAGAKALLSTFGLQNFAFFTDAKPGSHSCLGDGYTPISLAFPPEETSSKGEAQAPIAKPMKLTAVVSGLSPGEYVGSLVFRADGADSVKLPLVVQVRHYWLWPVLVIVFGSGVGWFTSKYLVAKRKAGAFRRQIKILKARADFLSRVDDRQTGAWRFPSEAGSLPLTRVRVSIHQLLTLTKSAMPFVVHEDDVQQMRRDVELRLTALESLRSARLSIGANADGRPAAQLAIGRLLRSAMDVLERPLFSDADQAEFANILTNVRTWSGNTLTIATYQAAITNRLRGTDYPDAAGVANVADATIRAALGGQLKRMPTEAQITAQTTFEDLRMSDQIVATLLLVWRERAAPWAANLADACAKGDPLDGLFRLVDEALWAFLGKNADKLRIAREVAHDVSPKMYEVERFHLATDALGMPPGRVKYHPLQVEWRVTPSDGNARVTQTDGLTLVQYFASTGKETVEAVLVWDGNRIGVPGATTITAVANPDYRLRQMFTDWTQYAAIAVAIVFSAATALATLYDSTFGSLTQYLGLFVWAAGAGTGGNLFNQLGTTTTAGGRESTLSKG